MRLFLYQIFFYKDQTRQVHEIKKTKTTYFYFNVKQKKKYFFKSNKKNPLNNKEF